jgi:hypothetical protein
MRSKEGSMPKKPLTEREFRALISLLADDDVKVLHTVWICSRSARRRSPICARPERIRIRGHASVHAT